MSPTIDPQAIEQLPPALLQTLPAGTPPPGVQSNFVDPPTLVPAVLGVGASFLVLALFCFVIRAWTKLSINKRCSWDDCKCFVLALYFTVEVCLPFSASNVHLGLCKSRYRKTIKAALIIAPMPSAIRASHVRWHSFR